MRLMKQFIKAYAPINRTVFKLPRDSLFVQLSIYAEIQAWLPLAKKLEGCSNWDQGHPFRSRPVLLFTAIP